MSRFALPVLILLLCACYLPSLDAPFAWDDDSAIVKSPSIRSLNWGTFRGQGTATGRPLLNLTFALDYASHGLSVQGYHAVNLGIHLACALLLFLVVRATAKDDRIAFAVASVWSLHPMLTESVSQVAQRAECLMGLLYLLTLYSFIRGWHVLTVVSCALGMTCKEAMVTAPLVVLFYDWTFTLAIRKNWRTHLALFSTWLILIPLVSSREGTAGFDCGVGMVKYLSMQPWIVLAYFRHWFSLHEPPYVRSWMEIPQIVDQTEFIIADCIVGALLAFTAWALWKRYAAGFLLACVFVILSPSSSFVPVCSEFGAEHRIYLPSAALAAMLVSVVFWFASRLEQSERMKTVLAVGILAAFAGTEAVFMFQRNSGY